MIYSRSMPGSELLTRLLTMVSDLFVRELVHIVKELSMLRYLIL